jgi:hypothetical protein
MPQPVAAAAGLAVTPIMAVVTSAAARTLVTMVRTFMAFLPSVRRRVPSTAGAITVPCALIDQPRPRHR